MTRPILVTGGTGKLGRAVVAELLERDRRPRVLSRRAKNSADPAHAQWVTGDLAGGDRVADAVADVDAIIHCATDYRHMDNDVHGTRRIIDTALLGGSPHLIYASIVGVDRIPLKMYRFKLGIEEIVQRGGLPWSVQRLTQFHDLVLTILRNAGRFPLMPLPSGLQFQSIDTRDAARRLVDLALGEPVGRAGDVGGPLVQTTSGPGPAVARGRGKATPDRVGAGARQGHAGLPAGLEPDAGQRGRHRDVRAVPGPDDPPGALSLGPAPPGPTRTAHSDAVTAGARRTAGTFQQEERRPVIRFG